MINYDDFSKIDLRTATVISAADHPKADKLIILKVKLKDEERQIIAGIRPHYTSESMVGKQIIIVSNLEPRNLRGEVSHGMLLAVRDGDKLSLVTLDTQVSNGLIVG